jgi:hypothetical protein
MPARAEIAGRYAEQIRSAYAEAELKILRAIRDRLKRGISEPGWAELKLQEIRLIQQTIAEETGQLSVFYTAVKERAPDVEQWLTESFANGEAAAAREMGKHAGITVIESSLADAPKSGLRVLTAKLVDVMRASELRILRSSMDIYRSTVAQSAQQVLLGSQTRLGAAQSILNNFAARGVASFVDRSERKWDMASYAEMSVRAAVGQAQNEGRIQKFVANGRDLVIVSRSPESCPSCDEWEGRILSISGASDQYPSVAEATSTSHLCGPNCTHTLNLYTIGLTELKSVVKENADAYQERERQRYLERGIRAWKRREAVALDDREAAKASAKVHEWQASMREFIADTGRRRKSERESISGRAR